jgi:hypothetical protein
MRRSLLTLPLAFALAMPAVAGCSSTKEMLGLTKRSPDEFQVVSRAPLSMPPDYSLRPPTPGAPRSTTTLQPDQIPSIGEGEQTTTESAGESAFLQSASLTGIDPNIRKLVDQETAADQDASQSFLDDLVFWRAPEPYGTVVDPVAEQKRLQENQALGQPTDTGETPIIERKKKGLFEGVF